MSVNNAIKNWMRRNVRDHIDGRTGEVNMTSLVEAWDCTESTGAATLDELHPAWDVAVEVADETERSLEHSYAHLERRGG